MECPIEKWARFTPKRRALSWKGRTLTYEELNQAISKKALTYSQEVFYPISSIDCITLFALFRAKACALPINQRLPKNQQDEIRSAYADRASPKNCSTALLTSGTTDKPKLACHSFENFCLSASLSAPILRMNRDSRTLLALPLFHVSGISSVFRTFHSGGHLIVPDTNDLEHEITTHEITHISLVPTQLTLFKNIFRNVTILLGGAPCPEQLLEKVQHHTIFHSYGMTETTAMVLCNGNPLEGIQVHIDEKSYLSVRTPTLFQGYYSDNMLHSPTLQNGFFSTGDLARKGSDGKIIILGRGDRMFISGGENIQPSEIERILESHPEIEKAIVKPIHDDRFGQVPIAYIHPLLSYEILEKYLNEALPKYKIPKKFLPMSALGGKYGVNF